MVLLSDLLENAKPVGGVYQLDYTGCIVVTNDLWKSQSGGIARYSYLLASCTPPGETAREEDDEEIMLLRVEGVAALPNERELTAARFEHMRERMMDAGEVLDALTHSELQWSGLECVILGTFYMDDGEIRWGADVDNVYSVARYKVYKPSAKCLSYIVSYDALGQKKMRIGRVRYASTQRRDNMSGYEDVPVLVPVEDFVSRKTAIFGMTRAGKSNTVKTIATEIFRYSREQGDTIGQLIFDPAGEYANLNTQDRTALRLIGGEWVSVYRFGATASDKQLGVKPLQINFFDEDQRSAAKEIIAAGLSVIDAAYVTAFLYAGIEPPDAGEYAGGTSSHEYQSALAHASRGLFAFYALLAKAGFKTPRSWQGIKVSMSEPLARQILASYPHALHIGRNGSVSINTGSGLVDTMQYLISNADDELVHNWASGDAFQSISNVYTQARGTAALGRLRGLEPFHNVDVQADHRAEVYEELLAGKIVIVDLSRGSDAVVQNLSERIVTFILDKAGEQFAQGRRPPPIQVSVEEAHILFGRDKNFSNAADPWVRIAKEAAKFNIGLVYATQEVSAVQPQILSNTHNWIISHLNSHKELHELSQYYDFESFTEAILRSEDQGYARMKTLSGNYIVPVQIDLFQHQKVNAARVAAGLPEIAAPSAPTVIQDTNLDIKAPAWPSPQKAPLNAPADVVLIGE